MTSRRTLAVTSTFPQYEGDERGAFLLRHYEALHASGDEVSMLVGHTAWTRMDLRPAFRLLRFPYAPSAMSTLTGRFGILENIRERPWRAALLAPYVLRLRAALMRELNRRRYDRVVAHFWLPCGLVVARVCAGEVPFEVYGHGTDVDLALAAPRPMRAWIGRSLAKASHIYLPSSSKRDEVLEALGGDVQAERLGVDAMTHTIDPAPEDIARQIEGRYLLFLGRLIAQKGVDVLLEAAAHHPGLRLVIAGDGPLKATLQRRAENLGLDAQFVGWVQGPMKRALIRDAEAVVIPSHASGVLREGAPLVVAEAHAMGRPIVASDIGGISELSASIGARPSLVPPGDPAALSQAIRDLAP